MHGKVIQIKKGIKIDKATGGAPMDSLDLEILDEEYFKKYHQHIFEYAFDCSDEEEYKYDVKGFLNFLSDNNYGSTNISDTILDHENYMTISDKQRKTYLEKDKYPLGVLDSPAIYITYRTSTMECYKIFSLYDWMKNDVEPDAKYYIGPIMDVRN